MYTHARGIVMHYRNRERDKPRTCETEAEIFNFIYILSIFLITGLHGLN